MICRLERWQTISLLWKPVQQSKISYFNHRPDHGQKLAEGGNQEQASLRVRRSYIINKSASEQSGAIFIPKFRKEQDHD